MEGCHLKTKGVATLLAVFCALSGLVLLSSSNASAALNSTVQTANDYGLCDPANPFTSSAYLANVGSSSATNYNAPASDAHPQFYLSIESHVNTGCTALIASLKITVTGTYPDGSSLTGDRFNALSALPSPDSTGSYDVLMNFVRITLQTVDPTGASNYLDLIDFSQPQGTGIDSASAWGVWSAGCCGFASDKGLRFGFQLAIDATKSGLYSLHYTYEVVTKQSCGWLCTTGWDKTLSEDAKYCYLKCNPTQVNNAQFISQSVPATMTPGLQYSVSVTMKNTGTTTWFPYDRGTGYYPQTCADCKAVYRLGSQNPQDNLLWNRNRVDLTSVVPPGQTYTFSFVITAPQTPGYLNFQWRMVQESVEWFGDFSPNTQVAIGGFARITNTIAASESPSVAVDSSGNYHLAWVENNKEIHYAKVDPNRNILVGDSRLTTSSGSVASPAIAVSSTGTVIVLWSDSRSGNYELFWKKYTGSWGPDQVKTATVGDAKDPDFFIDSNGYVRFVYRTVCRPTPLILCNNLEQEKVIYGYDTGSKKGPSFTPLFYYNGSVISQAHNDRLYTPRIALGSNGQMHVAFSQGPAYKLEFTPTTIYYVRYSGSAWGSAIKVGGSQDSVRRTAIGADAGNMVYVAWETWGNGFDIYLTKSSNGGVTWPASPPTNTFGADVSSYQYAPAIAIGPNQVVYLSWSDNRDGQYEIYYSYSTNLGGTWSGPIRLTNAAGDSLYVKMAVSQSSGRVGFVWKDYRNSVNNDGNWEIYFAS